MWSLLTISFALILVMLGNARYSDPCIVRPPLLQAWGGLSWGCGLILGCILYWKYYLERKEGGHIRQVGLTTGGFTTQGSLYIYGLEICGESSMIQDPRMLSGLSYITYSLQAVPCSLLKMRHCTKSLDINWYCKFFLKLSVPCIHSSIISPQQNWHLTLI